MKYIDPGSFKEHYSKMINDLKDLNIHERPSNPPSNSLSQQVKKEKIIS